MNEGDQPDEQDEDDSPPSPKRERTRQTSTTPKEIDTDALFSFIAPLKAKQIRAASSLLMSAYLKLQVEETISHMEDIDNMNQLPSLKKLVTINTRPGPSSMECSGGG